jgi:hypothetical protein
LDKVAGRVVRFQFELSGTAALYSFWVSRSRRGESGGYVAAGGEGFGGMADV